MSSMRIAIIECDRCHRFIEAASRHTTVTELREEAKRAGWKRLLRPASDLCPDCVDELEGKE